jgi:uncharacterized repeat protein (TIGR03847 family)
MIDLGTANRVAAGAIGDPGDRTFYLEVTSAAGTMWFVVEKLQVAALAMQIDELIEDDDIADDDEGITDDPVPAFRVAEIRIAPDGVDRYRVELHPEPSSDAEAVHFAASGATLGAMTTPALSAVRAGRPRCPRCGLAMDPDGHPCPTGNGDLRDHRP